MGGDSILIVHHFTYVVLKWRKVASDETVATNLQGNFLQIEREPFNVKEIEILCGILNKLHVQEFA